MRRKPRMKESCGEELMVKKELAEMSVMDLMCKIVEEANMAEVIIPLSSMPYCQELMTRLSLPSMNHASLLSVFINHYNRSDVDLSDIASFYDVRNIQMLAEKAAVDWLVEAGYLVCTKNQKARFCRKSDVTYSISGNVMENLAKGLAPQKEVLKNLDAEKFLEVVDSHLKLLAAGDIERDEFFIKLTEIINDNTHLEFVKKWKSFGFHEENLLVYIVMSMLSIFNGDDQIVPSDLEDFFTRMQLRRLIQNLVSGANPLIQQGLVEHNFEAGQANPYVWKLTDKSKYEVYKELKLKSAAKDTTNLTLCKDIKAKTLYYSDGVTKQVERLNDLFDKDRMARVLSRMESAGMRKGFTCLFYGGPGTGKTETVMQLARQSGRDIMLVDVPSIRSKWVGETEANIKRIFQSYGTLVHNAESCGDVAPILVFNEADALLNKRLEGGTNAVDKMENAMQNIILQEMENLEGIMIATTNLTGSLDDAFERRFLYKIEFTKPTPKERQHIWKAMLKDLSDEQALDLAERFDFSGGQIENIARKRIINDILDENDSLNIQDVIESCKCESIKSKNERRRIGFTA